MYSFFQSVQTQYRVSTLTGSTRLTSQLLARQLPFLLLFALLSITSCKKPIAPQPALTINAGADQHVSVGQLVTLEGTVVSSDNTAPLTFQWSMVRQPATSRVVLAPAKGGKVTFTPDEVGEYELKLTGSDGSATQTDNVVITASAAQPLTIDKDITVQTVLADRIANPNLPDYIVSKSIAVKHQLTLQPGVVIAFERDVRLDVVATGGSLIARGTSEKKIRFVGLSPVKGYWAGIILFSASNANTLEQVEVLHAGSQPLSDNKKAGLVLFKESQISLKNCLFAQHGGYGLFASEESILREFATNTFADNTEAGILLATDNVAKLDAASIFTSGNGRNVVEINGPYLGGQMQVDEIVWGGFTDKTPYRLLNDVMVRAAWKLSPGVTIEVERNASIHINESGYLQAIGTQTQPIRFKGAGTTAAYWKGILCLSASNQNRIENAEILNAGSSSIVGGQQANLAIYGEGATMDVRTTHVGGSGGYGILVGFGARINDDVVSSNTFTGNAQANVEYTN
ncbi:hypothetical protein GCM10027341_52970 [Spirosoma knui]